MSGKYFIQILIRNSLREREREINREIKREKAMTDIEVLRALTSKRVGNMKKHMKEN